MLHIGCWYWSVPPKPKYDQSYVDKLSTGIRRHMKGDYQWHVFDVQEEDRHLTLMPGCFARLRTFEPAWQRRHGISPGEHIVIIDLDSIIVGPLDSLFGGDADFTILTGANSANPCPTTACIWQLRAGTHSDVWTDFSLEAVGKIPKYAFPDDQGWMWVRIPKFASWPVGKSGIYAFGKPAWNKKDELPANARVVSFPGFRDPSMFTHVPWVAQRWVVHEEVV